MPSPRSPRAPWRARRRRRPGRRSLPRLAFGRDHRDPEGRRGHGGIVASGAPSPWLSSPCQMEPTVRIPSALPSHSGFRRSWKAYGASPTTCTRTGIPAPGALRPDRQRRLEPLHNPLDVLAGMVVWARLLDDPTSSPSAAGHRRFRSLPSANGGTTVPSSPRHGPVGRSPTSAPSRPQRERSHLLGRPRGPLAGDHMKTASDMALPLVGVGLSIGMATSARRSTRTVTRSTNTPTTTCIACRITRVLDREDGTLSVGVELPGREVRAESGSVQVGRVPVLLLDTDTPANDAPTADQPHPVRPRSRECGSTRSSSWASAACGPCEPWASPRPPGT